MVGTKLSRRVHYGIVVLIAVGVIVSSLACVHRETSDGEQTFSVSKNAHVFGTLGDFTRVAGLPMEMVNAALPQLPGIDTVIGRTHDSTRCLFQFDNVQMDMAKGKYYLNMSMDTLQLAALVREESTTVHLVLSEDNKVSLSNTPKKRHSSPGQTYLGYGRSNWDATADSCLATMEFHVRVSMRKPIDSTWTESLSDCCRGYYHVFKDTTMVDSVVKIDCPKKK
jgi:hypothetical protein